MVRAFDIVEVAPPLNSANVTSYMGAAIVMQILGAIKARGTSGEAKKAIEQIAREEGHDQAVALLAVSTGCLLMGWVAMPSAALAESTLDIVKKRGELEVGVRYDMPPYGYIGDNGSVSGLDIVIVNTIAQKLGVKLHLTQVTAQTRIQCYKWQCDLVAAGVAGADERSKLSTSP